MKKYGRQLKEIWIQHNCHEDCVDYGFEGRSKQRFSIQDDGKTLKWSAEPKELSLLVLPTRTMGSVLAAALASENYGPTGKITRDLNTRTMTGGSLSPLHLCHAPLNTKFTDEFWNLNSHRVRMSSSLPRVKFNILHDFLYCMIGGSVWSSTEDATSERHPECQTVAMSALCAAGHTFKGFEAWITYPPLWRDCRFDVVGDEPSRCS
jgi:hypothetical protein